MADLQQMQAEIYMKQNLTVYQYTHPSICPFTGQSIGWAPLLNQLIDESHYLLNGQLFIR